MCTKACTCLQRSVGSEMFDHTVETAKGVVNDGITRPKAGISHALST